MVATSLDGSYDVSTGVIFRQPPLAFIANTLIECNKQACENNPRVVALRISYRMSVLIAPLLDVLMIN
jgi:hypothetical protein